MARPVDTLGVTADAAQFAPGWDWKGDYFAGLESDGYERFSQFSATPDTTAIYAGPARFSGVSRESLIPIGMVDGLQFSSNAQLARLYEIGSNRAFFTRGKTMHSLQFGRMLAHQKNILAALVSQAHKNLGSTQLNVAGTKAPGADGADSLIMMNLDSEYFNVPFGILTVFKTKGSAGNDRGTILAASYLEYCMFQGYNFSVSAQAPVIMENIGVEFDRVVPVLIK